jgi:hypothetical protein
MFYLKDESEENVTVPDIVAIPEEQVPILSNFFRSLVL